MDSAGSLSANVVRSRKTFRGIAGYFTRVIILVFMIQPGCTGNQNAHLDPETKAPQFQFKLTDFPLGNADITSVNVRILRIEVMQTDETWLTAVDYGIEGLPVDLLQYQNGYTIEVGNFTLQPGEYKQMRFVIFKDITIVENTVFGNTTHTVSTPSESFQYIKVLDHFYAGNNNHVSITVDFDAEHSLHQEVDHYIFTPNVRLKSLYSKGYPVTLTPVSIMAQDIQPTPPAGSVIATNITAEGLTALNSITIGAGSEITGNVAVVGTCYAPTEVPGGCKVYSDDSEGCAHKICLDGAGEIHIGAGVHQPAGYMIMGNRVRIDSASVIDGIVDSNVITVDPTATVPNRNNPLVSVPALSEFFTGYKGDTNVGADNSPLAEGAYKKLRLYDGESIVLTGGSYHFKKIKLGNNATIRCLETCRIFIRKRLTAGDNATIQSDLDNANALYIYLGKKGFSEGEHHHYYYETPQNYTPSNEAQDKEYDDDHADDDHDADEYDGDEIEYYPGGPVYFSTGTGSRIKAHVYAPYGVVRLGDNSIYTGTLTGHKVQIGINNIITGTAPSIIVSEPFIAETVYNGNGFQLDFLDNTNMKMINSANPNYIYYGTYNYNLATKIITFNYQTVDLVDPNCLSCRATGIYPAIATYPVNVADIPAGLWGIEMIDMNNTALNARIISDGTLVTFTKRPGFGPYDSIF